MYPSVVKPSLTPNENILFYFYFCEKKTCNTNPLVIQIQKIVRKMNCTWSYLRNIWVCPSSFSLINVKPGRQSASERESKSFMRSFSRKSPIWSSWNILFRGALRGFFGTEREEGETFLSYVSFVWMVGIGNDSHLRWFRFPNLMYCSSKCSIQIRVCSDGSKFTWLTNLIHFSLNSGWFSALGNSKPFVPDLQ